MNTSQYPATTARGRPVWSLLVAVLAVAMGVMLASPVAASGPVKTEFSFPYSFVGTNVCSFPVTVDGSNVVTQTNFYDANGALTRQHWNVVEQDTFSANGKALVGIRFTFNMEYLYDSDGNLLHVWSSGVAEKIPLPDGSLFISAGRFDFVAHNFEWTLSPDNGNPGDIAAFCAALAP